MVYLVKISGKLALEGGLAMYWNGEKEVTKQEVRDIFDKVLKEQDALEMWVTRPDDFENMDLFQHILIKAKDAESFNTDLLDRCYDDEERDLHSHVIILNEIEGYREGAMPKSVCVYKNGRWLDAD